MRIVLHIWRQKNRTAAGKMVLYEMPNVSEHTVGQLMQMLMLATVVEGRLSNINPYGQPGVEAYKKNMMANLKAVPNLPKGEVADAVKGK